MEDAKLGIGQTQNVYNAHETGYLMLMAFAFLSLRIVEPSIKPGFALDAIEGMKLIMEHVCLLICLYLIQDAKSGIGRIILVKSVQAIGIWKMESVLWCQLNASLSTIQLDYAYHAF
jgi:hypothetical protein